MRRKVAKLIRQYYHRIPPATAGNPIKALKRTWNATPRNERYALRRRLEQDLE